MAVFGLGFGSANATVTIFAEIFKTKDITVNETITIDKFVQLEVFVFITPDKFAESDATFNQDNFQNEACENCAEKLGEIESSLTLNTGIQTLNQATGNMNNQGNIVSVAIDTFNTVTDGNTGFAESQAAGEQVMEANDIDSINILFRDAVLSNSVNFNTGITQFNQSVANMMNQANAISLAISFVSGVALSEADLGQFNLFNVHSEVDVIKTASAVASISFNNGITQGNQAGGTMGNQANVVSGAFTLPGGLNND
ncbi:MAG: hypothetical protein ACE1ZA_05010 [Pseudomonadales bacterium]